MNWNSMQSSIGLNFNFFDSNSHYFSRLREDSVSSAPLFQHEQPHRSAFDIQNTINFSDISLKLQHNNQYGSFLSAPIHRETPQDSVDWLNQSCLNKMRKGLKDLAKLLLQTIRSREPFCQAEIVKIIEIQLCKLKNAQSDDKLKTEKNIKRRIYDALNVMISAGLLEREASQIRIKPKQTIGLFQEKALEEIGKVQSRIEKKRELINQLKSQKKSLAHWIKHNQLQKSKKAQKKIPFPLIFVFKANKDTLMSCYGELFAMRNEGLQFFSETDVIQKLYRQEQSEKHLLEDLTLDLTEHL